MWRTDVTDDVEESVEDRIPNGVTAGGVDKRYKM